MNLIELARASGFLEGEGCFYVNVNANRGKTGRAQYTRWNITAAQKEREPLERLQRLFGGNIHLVIRHAHEYAGREIKETQVYRWSLEGGKVIQVEMTLYTLMSTRRREAIKKTIALWRSRPLRGQLPHRPRGGYCSIEEDRVRNDIV